MANENFDNNDLIAILKTNKSNFEFKPRELGFSFPCCICEFASTEQGEDPCMSCDHSWQ